MGWASYLVVGVDRGGSADAGRDARITTEMATAWWFSAGTSCFISPMT
jgi:hypothetical protein